MTLRLRNQAFSLTYAGALQGLLRKNAGNDVHPRRKGVQTAGVTWTLRAEEAGC
jgi:hypothetical protein